MSTLRLLGLPAIVMAVLAAPCATAQKASDIVASLGECRTIVDDRARLACFDRTSAALDATRKGKGIVVLDGDEVREKRRSLFGLNLPNINLFGNDQAKIPEVDEIESTLVSKRSGERDRFILRFADGSTWQTTEPARREPEVGQKVKVKRAALGSYKAFFNGSNVIRVRRIE